MEKNFTQSVLAMSAASVAMCAESSRQLAAPGAEIRNRSESLGSVVTVRIAPTHVWLQEKSALLAVERVETTTLRNTGQLSGYGFGTPAGVDVKRVDVAAGVPPRSRPV
jgi:hypothetical protein